MITLSWDRRYMTWVWHPIALQSCFTNDACKIGPVRKFLSWPLERKVGEFLSRICFLISRMKRRNAHFSSDWLLKPRASDIPTKLMMLGGRNTQFVLYVRALLLLMPIPFLFCFYNSGEDWYESGAFNHISLIHVNQSTYIFCMNPSVLSVSKKGINSRRVVDASRCLLFDPSTLGRTRGESRSVVKALLHISQVRYEASYEKS